ncbi:hypothetical protein GQX74_014922 [Glossina fuscipes]|nr:hypothetical protein GQX74_014922 [Glossina fuscipes]
MENSMPIFLAAIGRKYVAIHGYPFVTEFNDISTNKNIAERISKIRSHEIYFNHRDPRYNTGYACKDTWFIYLALSSLVVVILSLLYQLIHVWSRAFTLRFTHALYQTAYTTKQVVTSL